MAYQIEEILIILIHLQSIPSCRPFKCDFLYICDGFDKISTDIVRRAVLLVSQKTDLCNFVAQRHKH